MEKGEKVEKVEDKFRQVEKEEEGKKEKRRRSSEKGCCLVLHGQHRA